MTSKLFSSLVFLLPTIMSLSSCSDLRKAIGKEKVIPDEYSVVLTPSLIVPPGYKIDPEVFKKNRLIEEKNDFNLTEKIKINDNSDATSFEGLFISKQIPKNIRNIVDEETLGISLSERRGIDVLFGNTPETGVVIDAKKEALRIRKNKSSGKKINSTPSPAIDINSGKPLLIK